MVIKARETLVGAWLFLAGFILAVLIGVLQATDIIIPKWTTPLLVLIGLVIGLFNISERDINTFLLAAVSLVIVSYMGASGVEALQAIPLIGTIFNSLLILFVPAAVVVALKAVFVIAKR